MDRVTPHTRRRAASSFPNTLPPNPSSNTQRVRPSTHHPSSARSLDSHPVIHSDATQLLDLSHLASAIRAFASTYANLLPLVLLSSLQRIGLYSLLNINSFFFVSSDFTFAASACICLLSAVGEAIWSSFLDPKPRWDLPSFTGNRNLQRPNFLTFVRVLANHSLSACLVTGGLLAWEVVCLVSALSRSDMLAFCMGHVAYIGFQLVPGHHALLLAVVMCTVATFPSTHSYITTAFLSMAVLALHRTRTCFSSFIPHYAWTGAASALVGGTCLLCITVLLEESSPYIGILDIIFPHHTYQVMVVVVAFWMIPGFDPLISRTQFSEYTSLRSVKALPVRALLVLIRDVLGLVGVVALHTNAVAPFPWNMLYFTLVFQVLMYMKFVLSPRKPLLKPTISLYEELSRDRSMIRKYCVSAWMVSVGLALAWALATHLDAISIRSYAGNQMNEYQRIVMIPSTQERDTAVINHVWMIPTSLNVSKHSDSKQWVSQIARALTNATIATHPFNTTSANLRFGVVAPSVPEAVTAAGISHLWTTPTLNWNMFVPTNQSAHQLSNFSDNLLKTNNAKIRVANSIVAAIGATVDSNQTRTMNITKEPLLADQTRWVAVSNIADFAWMVPRVVTFVSNFNHSSPIWFTYTSSGDSATEDLNTCVIMSAAAAALVSSHCPPTSTLNECMVGRLNIVPFYLPPQFHTAVGITPPRVTPSHLGPVLHASMSLPLSVWGTKSTWSVPGNGVLVVEHGIRARLTFPGDVRAEYGVVHVSESGAEYVLAFAEQSLVDGDVFGGPVPPAKLVIGCLVPHRFPSDYFPSWTRQSKAMTLRVWCQAVET